jgi:predicted nucleotidyltransferase
MKKLYKNIALKYASILNKNGISVDAMYLFGSRIKGTNTKNSDLDTCIVSKNFGKDKIKNTADLYFYTKNASPMIEPHPFSLTDFNDKSNDFAREIQRTGIQII